VGGRWPACGSGAEPVDVGGGAEGVVRDEVNHPRVRRREDAGRSGAEPVDVGGAFLLKLMDGLAGVGP